MGAMSVVPKVSSFGCRMAKVASNKSTYRKPVGAALLHKQRTVLGWNAQKSSPYVSKFYKERSRGRHAEAALFRNIIPGTFRGAKVFVYRERKDGSLALSRPCEGCMNILRLHDVKQVTYSTNEGGYVTERL